MVRINKKETLVPTVKKELLKALPDGEAPDGRGFGGNISGCDEFVTDGYLLLLRSAIDAMLAGEVAKISEDVFTKPTKEHILQVWEPAQKRKSLHADFIGSALFDIRSATATRGEDEDEAVPLAVLRDDANCAVLVDSYLLRFILRTVHPDEIRLDSGVRNWQESVSFFRGSEMVALLMPMRIRDSELHEYDIEGEPVPLEGL